jgi:hypothetical protein
VERFDNTSGSITSTADTLLGPGSGASNIGTLAVLTLSGQSPGSSGIDLSSMLLLDSNLNPISFDLQGAGIDVAPAVATPEPSSVSLIFAAGDSDEVDRGSGLMVISLPGLL